MSDSPPPAPPATLNCTDDSIEGGLCYQIIPSSQLATSLWVSLIGGILCLIAFAYLRGHKTWRPIYHKRATQISDLLCRPAPLRLTLGGGLQRIWSYLTPALTLTDASLLATAGLDTLILIRYIQMGIQMFLPMTIIAFPILLPIYRTGGAVQDQLNSNNGSVNAESYMKNTLSNISYGSSRLWAPWFSMLFVTVWSLWCLWAHCRSYAALQAIHTHASVLVRGLDDNHALPAKEGDDEAKKKEEFVAIAGLTKLVGTSIARETQFGPGARGWWKAAGKLLWESVNPLAMLKSDVKLVEQCVQRMDKRLRQLKRHERELKKERQASAAAGRNLASKTFKRKFDAGELNPWAGLQLQDWGDAVDAKVPEVVCPWWLQIEDTPAAVNPVLQGGGVLLGKTSPHLRARVLGKRGAIPMWVPASSFAVLYRAGGPTPTDHWAKFLHINDRMYEAEKKLDEEAEELLNAESSAVELITSSEGALTFNSGSGGGEVSGASTLDDEGEVFGATTPSGKSGKRFSEGVANMKTKILHTSAEIRAAAGEALEKTLRKLYPTTFQELVPVYNHIPADKAMQKWDHTAGELARVERQIENLKKDLDGGGAGGDGSDVEVDLKGAVVSGGGAGDVELGSISRRTPTTTTTTTSPPPTKRAAKKAAKKATKAAEKLPLLVQKQKELITELAVNEAHLATARAACLANPLGTAYFALFTSQRDARAAAAGHIGATPVMNMTSEMAPGPDDVNWQGLWAGWRERAFRTFFYCTIPMVVIIFFPIGPLTGALTNLTTAVCGSGTSDATNANWAWFCDSKFLQFLFTVIAPMTLSTFWDTWVMPMVLFIVCQAQRAHASFSALDKSVVRGFYAFSFLNTFIGAVLGGSFLQQLGAALADGKIIDLVGTALPSASNFFLNYIGVHALFTNLFRFIWPHDGTVLFVFFRYFGWCLPGCERDEWVIRSTPSYRSGRHYGAFQATYIMALSYACVAPMILPITAVYFLTAFITWRYSAIHFYEPCYDGGGRIFELSYTLTLVTLILANIFTACVILTKGSFWIGGSLIAVSVLIIVLFWTYCNAHVMNYTMVVPMQAAEMSATAVVPRETYLPPVLRRGAVGWFPEGGKIWEKYGLPKFVF